VGWLGNVHPELAKDLELPEDTILFELAAAAMKQGRNARFQEISRYPAIRRDLAFVMPRLVTADDICAAVTLAAGACCRTLPCSMSTK